jgi:hypothetical protein
MLSFVTAVGLETKKDGRDGSLNFQKPGSKTASAGSST